MRSPPFPRSTTPSSLSFRASKPTAIPIASKSTLLTPSFVHWCVHIYILYMCVCAARCSSLPLFPPGPATACAAAGATNANAHVCIFMHRCGVPCWCNINCLCPRPRVCVGGCVCVCACVRVCAAFLLRSGVLLPQRLRGRRRHVALWSPRRKDRHLRRPLRWIAAEMGRDGMSRAAQTVFVFVFGVLGCWGRRRGHDDDA